MYYQDNFFESRIYFVFYFQNFYEELYICTLYVCFFYKYQTHLMDYESMTDVLRFEKKRG